MLISSSVSSIFSKVFSTDDYLSKIYQYLSIKFICLIMMRINKYLMNYIKINSKSTYTIKLCISFDYGRLLIDQGDKFQNITNSFQLIFQIYSNKFKINIIFIYIYISFNLFKFIII